MDWRVVAVTYNVGMKRASEETADAILAPLIKCSPSIAVIGLQEVAHAETLGSVDASWMRVLLDWMTMRGDLVLLAKNYQATNQMLVFVKKALLSSIRRLEYRFARNTMGGLTGHKGSIGLLIELTNNQSLVFVTSHFVHDVAAYERRILQYQGNRTCSFPEEKTVGSTFWLGDLNFRVELEPSGALDLLDKGTPIGQIVEGHDQLARAMREKRILVGFKEPKITFKPTYRLFIGSNKYDLKRTPSWCDRIVYKGSSVTPVSYDSISSALSSDHLPVMAVFDVKMPPFPAPSWDCLFEHLPTWYSTIPLIARFQLQRDFWALKGSYTDWIGVFPASIVDCTAAIRWVWLATCYNQTVDNEKYVVCEFPCLDPGRYRLGYCSGRLRCLVGLSKTFQVIEQPQ